MFSESGRCQLPKADRRPYDRAADLVFDLGDETELETVTCTLLASAHAFTI